MFLGFQAYDDEGLYLASIRDYLWGQPLMTPYLPLYGPFYFEVVGGIFRLLGVSPTHDTGRLVTLAFWLIASAVGGLAAWRLTRSLWLALAGQSITFVVLAALALEPTSTYGLSMLLELSLVVLATFLRGRRRIIALLVGGAIAALWLIKVNVGVFAAAAVAFAWAASLVPSSRRWLLPGLAVVVSVFPLAVMSSLLSQPWVIEFAAVTAFSIGSVAVTAVASTGRTESLPSLRWLILGGASVAAVCLGVALLGGSHPNQMLQSLFGFAVRFPHVYAAPLGVNFAIAIWAVALFAIAFLAVRLRRQTDIPAVGRVSAGLFTWASILLLPSPIFLLALPLAWLATAAPRHDADNTIDQYSRVFVPTLAVVECLQAYPVAGTQVSLAGLGMMPVGAILLFDGMRQLRSEGRALARWIPRSTLAVALAVVVAYGFVIAAAFSNATPLRLQGAQSVRVTQARQTNLRELVKAIDSSCSYLITYPGMNSFYIWTHQESSVRMRYTLWYLTIDNSEQASMVQQFKGEQGLCVVKNQKLIDFWTLGGPKPGGPLVDFVTDDFVHAGTFGDYELMVRASS